MKTFSAEQLLELGSASLHGCSDIKFFKRVQAVSFLAQGLSASTVSELCGFSCQSLYRLKAAFLAHGLDALRSHYVGSNNRYLSVEQESAILDELANTALSGQFIRVCEIKTLFESLAGVSYQLDAIYRILRRHGWRKVKPRGRHPKGADEASCEDAKKLTLWLPS
jgi:transposase